ncbi:MAG: 30S ribosomal protein S7 [Candidatus Micrarchaeia archaeon]
MADSIDTKKGIQNEDIKSGEASVSEALDSTQQVERSQKRQRKTAIPKESMPDNTFLKSKVKLFGKYDISNIEITDESVKGYVRFNGQVYPNIFGRRKNNAYYNSHLDIVERLVNKMMRGGTGKKVGGKVIRTEGRLQGKKIKVMHVVEDAFDTINKKTGKNPVQVFINALQNAAPIEDTTRVRYGGISYNVAVGISSNRRVDVALKNIALAALINAFNKRKKLSDALADELVLAADKAPESYAIKKRLEGERIAKRAR